MPVPPNDIVCKFVRKQDWSVELGQPKQQLFKGIDSSVWHQNRLEDMDATLADLQFGEFEGSGQLHLTVQEYLDIASKVASEIADPFGITVEWRSEDQYVVESWSKWREAHAQIEIAKGTWPNFPPAFRKLVIIFAVRKQTVKPPLPEKTE